ncbi:hypothetical protein NLG97_g1430 [Lecanicillium saksenae]|uniref:Uncharacterized protein n=1 Tax=Lecanicillium saksenae TaxID=468837 RepID=A0ACC1R521_9HYPO|nr:hypothetical protein NLG97_g1430 [Lecanicillium saksenae]
MTDLPDHHSVKRRRRPAKSCDACRARKVRCDQKMPCGPCTKARSTPKCIYGPDTIRLLSPDPTPEESGPGATTASCTPAALRHTPERVSPASSAEADQLRQQIAQLRTRVNTLETRLQANETRQTTLSAADLRVTPIAPRLRQTGEKNKIFGANHWIHTAKYMRTGNIGTKDVELSFETPKIDYAKIRHDMTKLRLSIKQCEMPILIDPVADVIATIPTRVECDALVDIYMATHERIYRVLHLPTFYREYEAFWQDQTASGLSFRFKLVLILALGSTLSEHTGECALADRQTRTWLYAAQWWLTGPTEKTTFNLEGVQVACLLQLVRQMTPVGRAWLSSGALLQMAFSVGLHRDPGHFPAMAPLQAQLQRQLWATVLELNLLSAMDSPMQAYVDLSACDTKPPDNINDDDPANSTSAPQNRPDGELTDASLQRMLCKSFASRFQAAKLMHSGSELRYTDIISLGNSLKSFCTEMSEFFETNCASPALNNFHRSLLEIHFRFHILRLHRQFLLQKPDEASCLLSRKLCFESAMVVASYSSHTASPDIHLRRLSQLFLRTTGTMRAPLSLEIITMLGLELRTQISEDDSGGRGPAGELAQAAREPIFTALMRIRDELLRRIERGIPQCKAFGLTLFIIEDLRNMERRGAVPFALSETVKENIEKAQQYMEATMQRLSATSDLGAGDFDLDALLSLDFSGDGGFGFEGFGHGMW